jgi:hypothetical protein
MNHNPACSSVSLAGHVIENNVADTKINTGTSRKQGLQKLFTPDFILFK